MTDHKVCLEIRKACELTFQHKYNVHDEDVIYDAMASIILQYYKNKSTILNFRSWLFGAIHHHFSSFIRNKKKESIFVFDDFILDSLTHTDYPETRVDIDYVKMVISELESPFREILNLRLLENRTHKEIANQLNLNPASVRKFYSRALERISKKVKLSVTLLVFNLLLKGRGY